MIKAKKYCWDIIKKYFPIYEGKNTLYKEVVSKYLLNSNVLLDAGCGTGKETPFNYREKVKLAIGIDLSFEIKNNNSIHKKIISDVSHIPLMDNSVDIIVCQELLEHLKEPNNFIKEVARVIKKGGKFIIMTPNFLGWRTLISKFTPYWFHLYMNKQLYGVQHKDVFPTYYHANTFKKIRQLLNANGFKTIENYFFEPSPKTLTFSRITTYLEILYTKLLQRFILLRYLRETLIIVSTKTTINKDNLNNNVLQIELAGKGGICHYTYNLIQELSKFRKIVLITSINYEFKREKKIFEFLGMFNRFKTNPLVIFKLIKFFKDNKVSIIHFQLSQYPIFIFILCCIVKCLTNKKIVITAHNIESHEEKEWEKYIYKIIYKLTDKLIVHAEANKSEIEKTFSINSNKVEVIPHGNYMFFNERHQPTPAESYNILFFGYIRKYKGLMYLIKALPLIKNKIPAVKLFIAGRPTEEFSEYEKEINKLGLKSNIETDLNYISLDKINDYFTKANVVVLPYLNIYQSGVVQLAYGFGRPVVATNVGGLPEVVEDGYSGYIVPSMNTEALAEKITTILENRELQRKMGNYALHLAKTKFSWDAIAKKTLELYNSIDN